MCPNEESTESEQGIGAHIFPMGQTQLSEWVSIDTVKLDTHVFHQVKSFKNLK